MRQNCAVFKFLSVGLMCLTYSFGGFANQTPDLAKKLLGAVANNDLGAVQQIIGEGADPRSNNENGISAIDMAVDKGFFDIAHLLLAAQKQNTRGLSKPSKISAEKQSLDQPDGPSVIDTISDFFKTNVSNASIVKAEPKPVLVEKKKITNTPDIESNPFTKLTDAILDFLPDGLQDEVETIHNVKPKVLIGSKTGSDEKVIYPVADLTEAESPYKIDKVVQVKELPRALESVKSITEPVVNVQPVAVAPLPNVKSRNLTQNLLAAQKQNTQGFSKSSKLSAEKQSLEQPDGPSAIDIISDFFKTNVSNASLVKAEPKPVLVEKKKITNTPDIESNPFTKLTDAILDFLPDGLQDEVETIHNVKPKVLIGSKTGSDEKVIYPVADLTEAESPYKIDKVVQVKELPRALESVKSITEPVVNVQPVAVAQLPNIKPRNLTQNDLVFGGRGRLDTVFEKVGNRADSCVIKASQKSVFCIESFNWPSEIQNGFETFGGVSGSGQSIVHYLNGKSVQYHGRFPNQSFNPIASYIMSKFGAPTEAPKTTTAMLGAASQPNRVYRWVTATTDDQPPVILEMREIDDLRWSLPPDRLNGLIRMYRKGEASIFKILTAADLLLLQIIKGGQQKASSSKGP